jgi:large subunit ribosomal protein L32
MGVQQHRRSKAKNRARRAVILKMAAPSLMKCPKCHKYKQPHRACPACGYYNEQVSVAVKKAD